MKSVSIIGSYHSKFGIHKDKSIQELIYEAGIAAIVDAQIDRGEIDIIYVANYASTDFNDLNLIGPFSASVLGIADTPSIHLENACSSGAVAIQQAAHMVAAGVYKKALVLGVEKMNTKNPEETMKIISKGGDPEIGMLYNISAPSIYALYATRHMKDYGTTKEQLSHVAFKNYRNGSLNPNAQKQKNVSLDRIANAPMITSPLGLHDLSLITDGAAAVVLSLSEEAERFTKTPVRIAGMGIGAEDNNILKKESYTSLLATVRASEKAYKMAGIDAGRIDMAEVHDCFTITEILDIEDLGFVKKGDGGPATAAGFTAIDGEKPVNMSGGLKAKGHPIGATGIAQACEIILQMKGEANERQVKKADFGLTHTLGGSPGIAAVNIYERSF